MSGGAWIEDVRVAVEAQLERYLEGQKGQALEISPESVELVHAIENLTMRGGKRLRAAVVAASYRCVGGRAENRSWVPAAAAVELLQSYLLIHDDWMDGDDTRRGGPSVHAALTAHHGDKHLGASLAVLAGDLASAYAWELLLGTPLPEGRQKEVLGAFIDMQREVFFGQHLDLVQSDDVSRMHQLKTGSYTVRGPMRLGAIAGNASPEQLALFEAAGRPLGRAFQLRDDILGTFGNSRVTGKPSGKDLQSGKRNAVVCRAREILSPGQWDKVEAVLGRPEATRAEIQRAVEAMLAADVQKAVEDDVERLVQQAFETVDSSSDFDPQGTQMLKDLARALTARDY